jgi:multidrug efflux pump subunit AcrA (membrane-fusion protein)
MKRLLWLLPLIAIGGLLYWIEKRRSAPPIVPFTEARRERLVSLLRTNGKVEPVEWAGVRAGREGLVSRIPVSKGDTVAAGAVLAEIDASETHTELAAAEAKVTEAKAQLEILLAGGRLREIAEINGQIERARVDLEAARKDLDALTRLVEKKAATAHSRDQAAERVRQISTEINTLEKRRNSLVSPQDRTAAEARVRESENAVQLARRRLDLSIIHAPMAGMVYQIDVRKGDYVRPGDPVAHMGRLERVKVFVLVDEPELGSVRKGLPVTITWDALAGKQWSGEVDRLPTHIVALGSRQVGEVICLIDNADRALLPGTNVNAEIRLHVVENALTIPKESLRREHNETGVFVLEGSKLAFRKLRLGAASITRLEVVEGLRDGDRVALPADFPLTDGLVVRTGSEP